MKKATVLWTVLLVLLLPALSRAQEDFDTYRRQERAAFSQFRQNEIKQFRQYRDSLNRVFKQYRDSCLLSLKRLRDSLNPAFGEKLKRKWQENKTQPPRQPGNFKLANHYSSQPVLPSPAPQENDSEVFYGLTLAFDIPPATAFRLEKITEEHIGDAWLHLNRSNLSDLITECQLIAKDRHFNSWGYYQLVRWLSGQIFPATTRNEKVLFHFFMLTQSGYKCKIGYTNDKRLTLLLPFTTTVYYRNFQEFSGISYYIMDDLPTDANIHTYSFDFPEAPHNCDLRLRQPPRFGTNAVEYKEFTFPDTSCRLRLPLDKHLIAFYGTYPSCPLDIYAYALPSPELEKTIGDQLAPLLNADVPEKNIARLLQFMYTAFRYKPDTDYWGRERYFFPEESLYYPCMDCEDYAILFRCFLRILTDCPNLLVVYPQHIATAVRLQQDITQGYILHNRQKYTLCDPSFKGSSPGEIVPAAARTQPLRVIE